MEATASAASPASAGGERPFADFLAAGPEPPAAASMDSLPFDDSQAAAAAAAEGLGASGGAYPADSFDVDDSFDDCGSGSTADLTATVDYAPAPVLDIQADALGERSARARWDGGWSRGNAGGDGGGMAAPSAGSPGQQGSSYGSSGAGYDQQKYLDDYQESFPSSYQEAGFDGAYDANGAYDASGAYTDNGAYANSRYQQSAAGGDYQQSPASGGYQQSPTNDSYGSGSYGQRSPVRGGGGYSQDPAVREESYNTGFYRALPEDERLPGSPPPGPAEVHSADGSSSSQVPPPGPGVSLADSAPAAAASSAGVAASAAQQLSAPPPASEAFAAPPADAADLVEEGLSFLRAGRQAAADGAALGDADRLLRQVGASTHGQTMSRHTGQSLAGHWRLIGQVPISSAALGDAVRLLRQVRAPCQKCWRVFAGRARGR